MLQYQPFYKSQYMTSPALFLIFKFYLILLQNGWHVFYFVRHNLHREYLPLAKLLKNGTNTKKNTEIDTFSFYIYNQWLFFFNTSLFIKNIIPTATPVVYFSYEVTTYITDFLNWINWGYKFKLYFLLKIIISNENNKHTANILHVLSLLNQSKSVVLFLFSPEYHLLCANIKNKINFKSVGVVNFSLNPWIFDYPIFCNSVDTNVQSILSTYILSLTLKVHTSTASQLVHNFVRFKKYQFYKKFFI